MKLFLASLFSEVVDLFPDFAESAGKTVTFIPTAGNVEPDTSYIADNRAAFTKLGIAIDDLDVSKEPTETIKAKLEGNDFIYIEGGNVFYLLQELRRSGADKIVRAELEKGKIYIGTSAGSCILSKDIEFAKHMDPVELAPDLNNDFSSIGAIDFDVVPHYGCEPFAESSKIVVDLYSGTRNLRAITNDQAVLVDGDKVWVATVER
jgi:dipeptidase E